MAHRAGLQRAFAGFDVAAAAAELLNGEMEAWLAVMDCHAEALEGLASAETLGWPPPERVLDWRRCAELKP